MNAFKSFRWLRPTAGGRGALFGAAVFPGRATPFVADGRSREERSRATAERLAAGATIAILLVALAAVSV